MLISVAILCKKAIVMEIDNLKYVVGQVKTDEPAIIRFFDSVTEWSAKQFNEEFLWLQNVVKPSKIIVMINSEGGTVVHGMSVFSVIQSCTIEVDCVIEGIAASMGSVIWAAGDNLFMHDYSLLMIHNPFGKIAANDKNTNQVISAFKTQLSIIYQKRFGLSKDQIKEIMDGADGKDGTFFTAQDAVKAGFLTKDHIIKTSKQVRDEVKNQIEGIVDATSLRNIMSSFSDEFDENKLLEDVEAIHNRKDNQNFQESKVMENENVNFETVSAQLGFSKETQVTQVTARITELIKAESDLKQIQNSYTQLEIKYNGKEAELKNVNAELEKANASLKQYKDAEAAALEAKINSTVQAAIDAKKIDASSKDAWIKLAHANYEEVKSTLDSIHGQENIPEAIASSPENVKDIEGTLKTVEERQKDLVEQVCGKFQFKKF